MTLTPSDIFNQAPITLYGLEGRYATALYTAAARQNNLEAVEKDLNTFSQAIKKDTAFKSFLENPTVPRATKLNGLSDVAKKVGKPSELTNNLLEVLAENGRLNTLDKVIEAYSELMSAHRNELPLVVTSAKVGLYIYKAPKLITNSCDIIALGKGCFEQDC